MYPQQIIDALQHVRYPGTGKNLIEGGMLEDDIRISGMEVSFSLIFEKDNDPFRKSVVKAAETAKKNSKKNTTNNLIKTKRRFGLGLNKTISFSFIFRSRK